MAELPLHNLWPDYEYWENPQDRIDHLRGYANGFKVGVAVMQFWQLSQFEDALAKNYDSAYRDHVTGLHNRRYAEEHLRAHTLAGLGRRSGELANRFRGSFMLIDIDDFKEQNDAFGHEHGDTILVGVAASLAERCNRDDDEVVRWGGDEFAVILPHTSLRNAQMLMDEVREQVQLLNEVTLSIGITDIQAGDTPADLYNRADRALYRAKDAGKNQSATIKHTA